MENESFFISEKALKKANIFIIILAIIVITLNFLITNLFLQILNVIVLIAAFGMFCLNISFLTWHLFEDMNK